MPRVRHVLWEAARYFGLAAIATLILELLVALLWPAPDQEQFDPSGLVGEGPGDPLRMAILGDSSCTAPGVASSDDIWVRIVARRLAETLDRPILILSTAVGGATSGDVVTDQLADAVAFDPDIVLISVGANDIIHGIRLARLRGNLDIIISAFEASGALVVASGIGDLGTVPRLAPPLRQTISALSRRADQVYTEVAKEYGAIKADQWATAAESFRTRRDIWSPDWFHPNARGHLIWADTAWETIAPHLETLANEVRSGIQPRDAG